LTVIFLSQSLVSSTS